MVFDLRCGRGVGLVVLLLHGFFRGVFGGESGRGFCCTASLYRKRLCVPGEMVELGEIWCNSTHRWTEPQPRDLSLLSVKACQWLFGRLEQWEWFGDGEIHQEID